MSRDRVMMVQVDEMTFAPEMVYGIRRDVQTAHGIVQVEVFDSLSFTPDCVEDLLLKMAKSYGRYIKRDVDGKPYSVERLEDCMVLTLHTYVGTRLKLTARWEEHGVAGLDSVPCILRDAEDAVNAGSLSFKQAGEAVRRACDGPMPFSNAMWELGYAKADTNPDMEREFFRCVAEMGSKALDPACFDELVQRVMDACTVKPDPSCLEAYVKHMLKLEET